MKVIVADDESRVRRALTMMLEYQPEVGVVGWAAKFTDLLTMAQSMQPDVILVDWDLLRPTARQAMNLLRLSYASSHIVVMSSRTEVRDNALATGARAFVLKADPVERLFDVMRKCVATSFDPGIGR